MLGNEKILVLGIGALGGVFSFKLIKNNFNCTLVTHNDNITKAITENGLIYSKEGTTEILKANVVTNLPENDQYDYIFLMMKTNGIIKASQSIKENKLLKPDGLVMTVQNGDVYEFIKEFFPNQLVTCILGWNATMHEPGSYELTGPGKTVIGDRNNKIDLTNLKNILDKVSPNPVEISTNLYGVIWSKLAINCSANSLSGITGLLMGEILKSKQGRELFFAIYREAVELSKLQNIKLEKVYNNDPYLLYMPKNANFVERNYKMNVLKIAGKKRFGKVKVSMLQDIERGKKTEIDYLNGYISKKGKELDFPTPVNDKLTELIKLIESKKLVPKPENLNLVKL